MQKAIGRDTRHYNVLQVSDHFFQQKIIRMTLINTTMKIHQVILNRLFCQKKVALELVFLA